MQAVINLAREIGADDLLPAAFYELSRHSFAQIFEPAPGSPLDPRSASTSASSASSTLDPHLSTLDPRAPSLSSAPCTAPSLSPAPGLAYTLAPGDLQRLALGKEAAQHAVTALIQNMEHAASDPHAHRRPRSSVGGAHAVATGVLGLPGLALGAGIGTGLGAGMGRGRNANAGAQRRALCVTPAACRKDLGELVELATQHYLFDRERGCADPLYVAEELGQLKSAEFADCAACACALEAWAARERERLWRAIPDWFRLR